MNLNFWKLPFTFDVEELQKDLDEVRSTEWVRHFNTGHHDGGWSGVALRSTDGNSSVIYPNPAAERYLDTPLLARCTAFQSVISIFQCQMRSVRLLKLTAGTSIHEHTDSDMGPDYGLVRLHIPILTNSQVEFYLDGQPLKMNTGECWYIDFGRRHRVNNLGETDRIHLVLDCTVNDWLRSMIPFDSSTIQSSASNPETEFEKFRLAVLRDFTLQTTLRDVQSEDAFISLAMETAKKAGYTFTIGDLKAAMYKGKKVLSNKWMI
jgi:hypothetical protein